MTPKLLFLLLTIGSFILAVVLFIRQNKPGRLGGPICKAKAFWLHYTIYNWFFTLPFALYILPDAPSSHRAVWMTLTCSMWIRGLAEMYMLFVSKNWTPIIGISHDLLTILMMGFALLIGGVENYVTEPVLIIFTASLFLSMCSETYYAYSFFQLMKGRTGGDESLWYAHKDDPRFKRIILVTTIFNYILYSALGVFFLRYLM
ncbi:MAG: hypothetical protein ACOYL6_06675 [Bacteriovoracaceae bacterium]